MILLTILGFVLLGLTILAIFAVIVTGVAGSLIFGDAIVLVVLIALIIRHFINKKESQ